MNRFDDLSCLDTAFKSGAFLCSQDNVMVASWGLVGVMWGKRVFVAPVRESRYTKECIDRSSSFAVCIPRPFDMLDAIKFCGSKSGREYDKWAECGLEKRKAKSIDATLVEGCDKYLECKVICKIPMDGADISAVEKWYPYGDLHTLYFGEIVEEYR